MPHTHFQTIYNFPIFFRFHLPYHHHQQHTQTPSLPMFNTLLANINMAKLNTESGGVSKATNENKNEKKRKKKVEGTRESGKRFLRMYSWTFCTASWHFMTLSIHKMKIQLSMTLYSDFVFLPLYTTEGDFFTSSFIFYRRHLNTISSTSPTLNLM